MFEKVSECPACGGDKFKNQLICQDYTTSGESFVLTDCETCGLRTTNPRPDKESISRYYLSIDYIPHQPKARSLFQSLYRMARNYNLSWKYNLIRSESSQDGSLLDFGSGTGEFLQKMKSKGWQVTGIETNEEARNISKKNFQIDVKENLTQLSDSQLYNSISLWHVLEHIHDPNSLLSELSNKLEKEGKLFIAVPNYLSYDAQKYSQAWAGYDVPRHLYHFNQETLKLLLKNNGYRIERKVPMKLDAYYVSMLSERNMKSKFPFIKGLITGSKSNRWASGNSNNYSSLVYIARK